MSRPPPFAELFAVHRALLSGRYLTGADALDDGGTTYLWSRDIPDPTMNFAINPASLAGEATPPDAMQALLESAVAAARIRHRAPAVLVFPPPGWAPPPLVESTYGALWMTLDGPQTEVPAMLEMDEAPVPDAGFAAVFAEAHADPAIADHVRRHYLAPLGRPAAAPEVRDLHLVGRAGGEAVACASVLVSGEIAGLYNVAVRHDRQGRGFGAVIAAAAAQRARAMGARVVFLQCPDGGPVERLYARLGFRRAYAPRLLCLRA